MAKITKFHYPLHLTLDKNIHEPARLKIIIYLYMVEKTSFLTLMEQTALTKGNLSSHLSKLETYGYVRIEKKFINKIPKTTIRLSKFGRTAFLEYRKNIQDILYITKI